MGGSGCLIFGERDECATDKFCEVEVRDPTLFLPNGKASEKLSGTH
jgi:hypothetical protein